MLIYLKEMRFGKCFISGRKRKDAVLFCLYWRRIFFLSKDRLSLFAREVCTTPGSRYVWHPGVRTYNTRVSVCSTSGCHTGWISKKRQKVW